jgi:hypothetical protein
MIGSQSQPHREAGRLAMVGRAYSRAAVPKGHPIIASTTRACFSAGCYGKKIISPERTAEFNQTPAVRHWSYSSYLFPCILNSGSNGIPRLPKPIEAYPRHSSRLGIDEKNLAKPKVAWRPSERARASPLKAKIKNHFPFGPAARACRVEVPPCGTKTGRLRTPLVTFGRLRKPTEGVPPRGPANALPTVTFPRLLALISSKHAQFQY